MGDLNKRPPMALSRPLKAMLRASDGILDLLPIATFICDARGVILQYNRHAFEIWGRAPAPGQTHQDFIAGAKYYEADGKTAARSPLAEVLATGVPVRDVERYIVRADGTGVSVSLNIDPLRNAKGELIGAVHCFTDITERKHIDSALETSRVHALEQEQRLAATYEHASIGISEVSPDGRFLRVNEAVCAITGFSREELLDNRMFVRTHPGDADADREGYLKQIAGELEFYSVEKRFYRKDGRVIWLSVRSSPVRAADGRLLYLVRVLQDITEGKAAERRQKLLIDELNHRVKNTLASVQSLAAQTARSAATPADFRAAFEGRLMALSKAHDQLTMHHWESAALRDVLTAAFKPYGADAERVALRGAEMVLRPRAVLTLAMVFHELITNAAKYGALSAPEGRVEVDWRLAEADGRQTLHILWAEQGGPPVVEPARRGFGSRLIEGGFAAELGGRARMFFAAGGLRCELDVPLDAVSAEDGRPPPDWSA